MILLRVDDVDWVEAQRDYVSLHVAGKKHLLRETVARIESQLDPANFIRIHRSTIVNLNRVKELHARYNGDYTVILNDGTRLTLSRGYRERVFAAVKQAP